MQHDLYPYLILAGVELTLVRCLVMSSRLDVWRSGLKSQQERLILRLITNTIFKDNSARKA